MLEWTTSTADLKSLHRKRLVRTRDYRFSSALGFPKFVQGGAARYHELRKEGTSSVLAGLS